MHSHRFIVPAFAVLALAACGASYPAPTTHMVDAKSTERSAEEGVAVTPQAELHVKLAKDQIARAGLLMEQGDNKGADYLLVRAKADADLAVALEKAAMAQSEEQRVAQQAAQLADGGVP